MEKYTVYLSKVTYIIGSIEIYADSEEEARERINQKIIDEFIGTEAHFNEPHCNEYEIIDIEK